MALRGFSKFEQMFRAKLASDAPLHVLKAKKEKEGLSKEEVRAKLCEFRCQVNQTFKNDCAENYYR